MTVNPSAIMIRSRKLGILLKDARVATNMSIEDCAKSMGISPSQYLAYESGEQSPSLPEIEMFAYETNVPPDHFWGNTTLSSADTKSKMQLDPFRLVKLRQKMVGLQIRQARQGLGLSLENLAEKVGVNADLLKKYELGEESLPLPYLEALAIELGHDIKDFEDRNGPVGTRLAQQKALQGLMELPPGLQSFVSKPINRPYLELAQRLSEMSVEKLRAVAEGLLEITL